MDKKERLAVIDVGSNSVKLFVAEKAHQKISILFERTEITRLSEGLTKNGVLQNVPMERNIFMVETMIHQAKALEVEGVIIVGTMALRIAQNREVFIDRLAKKTGFTLSVLSGEEEGELAFLGALSGLFGFSPLQEVTLFDIGGGSTEFVRGKGREVLDKCSIALGSVPLTERYLQISPVSDELLQRTRSIIKEQLEQVPPVFKLGPLLGIGGTITTLASVHLELEAYSGNRVHGMTLTKRDVNEQILQYASRTIADRCKIKGLSPGRADIILAGACIADEILGLANEESFVVSDRGLRHGVAIHYFEESSGRDEPLLLP
ncbi:MAG: Ppx/GppA family phosphatase [Aminobacterium colombiense]|nr:Ppx/GppA family phosphatase [Aminobacterium colombiense]